MTLDLRHYIEEFNVTRNQVYTDYVKPYITDVHKAYMLRENGPFDAFLKLWQQKDLPDFTRDNFFYDLIYNSNVVNYFNKSLNFDIFAEGKKAVIDYPINNPTFNNLEGFLYRVLGNLNFKLEQGENLREVIIYLPMNLTTGGEDNFIDDTGDIIITDGGYNIVFFKRGDSLEKLQSILKLFMPATATITFLPFEGDNTIKSKRKLKKKPNGDLSNA